MQSIIDFLVNNYLWFIIIALILVFALIGYLVDTSERKNKEEDIESIEEKPIEEPIKANEPVESINMNMGMEEDVKEEPPVLEEKSEETEILDDEEL